MTISHTGRSTLTSAPLVVAPASSRYAELHALDLRLGLPGCRKIAKRLWRLPPLLDLTGTYCHSAGHEILLPIARAPTYKELVERVASSSSSSAEPWRLRFEDHHAAAQASRDLRASDYLCGVAAYLDGPPAVITDPCAAVTDLVLLRTRRLWYLCEVQPIVPSRSPPAGPSPRGSEAAAMWAQRPYSFSAATQLELARLAVSLAISHHAAKCDADGTACEGTAAAALLDPCCGSGTVLLAAALQGRRAVGCDLNPTAVAGARRNLAFASKHASWAAAPSVHLLVRRGPDAPSPSPFARRWPHSNSPGLATRTPLAAHLTPVMGRAAGLYRTTSATSERRCRARGCISPVVAQPAHPARGVSRRPPPQFAPCAARSRDLLPHFGRAARAARRGGGSATWTMGTRGQRGTCHVDGGSRGQRGHEVL